MSKQRDPRLVEKTRVPVKPTTSSKMAAAIAAKSSLTKSPAPAPPTADMEPPRSNGASGTQKTRVARRKKLSSKQLGERPAWLSKALIGLACLALLYFVYSCVESINNTLKQNQRNETITTVWRQLLSANTTISGTPTQLDENGSPRFPFISFESSRSRADLHRNLRLATALPGIQSIGLSPETTRSLGSGVADDSTLLLVAGNFSELDSLSLSATRISSVEALDNMRIRELRLVNTPIKREKLGTLATVKGVTDLWIGWEPDPRNPDHNIFVSDLYKQRMIDAIARMPDLRNLYIFNLTFDTEEMKKLNKLNIKNLQKN